MHDSVGKNQDIAGVVSKFKVMETQLGSIKKNLEERSIEGLIERSQKLMKMFEQIASKNVAMQVSFPGSN